MYASVAVQFALAPSFSHLTFADEASCVEPLQHVYKSRNRKEDVDEACLKSIQELAPTVGDLRRMTDHDWAALKIPLICKVFLKYCVRQSARRESSGPKGFMELLADEFNFGQPYDMSLYQAHIDMLTSMGFKPEEAMEALVITENKGIEGALEILFQRDPKAVKLRRAEAARRLGRQVQKASFSGNVDGDIANEQLTNLRNQLTSEQQRRQKLETDLRSEKQSTRKLAYKDFIKGITAEESFGLLAYQALQTYQKDNKITKEEHEESLRSINLTVEQFEAMKNFEKKDKRDNECVVCLDNAKDHVVMPCMHLCLCVECAEDFEQPKAKCPMCSKKVRKVVRIFY